MTSPGRNDRMSIEKSSISPRTVSVFVSEEEGADVLKTRAGNDAVEGILHILNELLATRAGMFCCETLFSSGAFNLP